MRLGYVMTVHQDGEGGPPFYTMNLEGVGEQQTEGERLFPVATDSSHSPTRPVPHTPS
jgi:hypothetical protein